MPWRFRKMSSRAGASYPYAEGGLAGVLDIAPVDPS